MTRAPPAWYLAFNTTEIAYIAQELLLRDGDFEGQKAWLSHHLKARKRDKEKYPRQYLSTARGHDDQRDEAALANFTACRI